MQQQPLLFALERLAVFSSKMRFGLAPKRAPIYEPGLLVFQCQVQSLAAAPVKSGGEAAIPA